MDPDTKPLTLNPLNPKSPINSKLNPKPYALLLGLEISDLPRIQTLRCSVYLPWADKWQRPDRSKSNGTSTTACDKKVFPFALHSLTVLLHPKPFRPMQKPRRAQAPLRSRAAPSKTATLGSCASERSVSNTARQRLLIHSYPLLNKVIAFSAALNR